MIVNTGFGYYIDSNGKKMRKYELPKGTHPDPIGYTVVEVASQKELDNIVLDKSDIQIADEQKKAQMQIHKQSALLKLKGLGLNDSEINAIIQ